MAVATMTMWKRGLLGALCLGAGVAGAEPPPTNSAQGTQLHGAGRFEFINVPLRSVELADSPEGNCNAPTATVAGGQLKVTQSCVLAGTPMPVKRMLEGPSLEMAVFRAPFEGRTVKLVIDGVRCHVPITPTQPPACDFANIAAGTARWEYKIRAVTDDQSATPLCPTGSGYALAVPHAWSTSGDLLENPNYFTFACVPQNESTYRKPFFVGGGVIAKCIDWGYPPWATEYLDSVAREYHQLCTRMATADYCGEGHSNTLDGTPLAFMGPENAALVSTNGALPAKLAPDGYALEAVWTMDTCGLARPLCLGKKRWDTLAADATCLDSSLKIPVPKRSCEDMNLLGSTQRMLVSYSLFIDRPLVVFKNSASEYVTTTAVEGIPGESAGGTLSGAFILAMKELGTAAPGAGQKPLLVEGPILSPTLPQDTKDRMKAFIKPLYRCGTSTGRMLLTDREDCDQVADYKLRPIGADKGIEGYIYSAVNSDQDAQRRPLKLWQHPTLGGFATATRNPGGFTFIKDLGFLPAVGQLPGRDL